MHSTYGITLAFVVGSLFAAGCAPSCPRPGVPAPLAAPPARLTAPPAARGGLVLTLAPRPAAPASVEVTFEADAGAFTELVVPAAAPGAIDAPAAHDGRGPLPVELRAAGRGAALRFGRRPEGRLVVRYRVRATSDPMAPVGAVVAADDRFRALGPALVPVPVGAEDTPVEATVVIDGAAIAASHAMSSLGLGATRTRKATPRALARGMYVAGSLGTAVLLEAAGDRDEIGWLGYTAFDPRPAAAEIASVRTALRESWKGGGEDTFTLAFVSTSRPAGRFGVTALPASAVVHLGPSEPWSARMRVSITQALGRPWLGGELDVTAPPDHEGRALWFREGVARFYAVRTLSRLGLLAPNDAAAWVNGLLADHALSPHRGRPRDEIDARPDDPLAASELAGRGALHALRTFAAFTKTPAGAAGLDTRLLAHMKARRETPPRTTFDERAWVDLVRDGAGEGAGRDFEATVLRGQDSALPDDLLGPCFRKGTTKAETTELGFDLDATLDGLTKELARFDPKGPAAAAGARATDVLLDAALEKGKVTLTLRREGQETKVTYAPTSRATPAPAFVRLKGTSDAECGLMLGR